MVCESSYSIPDLSPVQISEIEDSKVSRGVNLSIALLITTDIMKNS